MTSRYFNVPFSDLNFEAQESIIKSLIESLQEEAKVEGRQLLAKDWHDPAPKTWQEAYCRTYAIEHNQWSDYEDGNDVETPAFMWESWQEEHVRHMAREKAELSFKRTEIEVEL